MKIKLLNRTDIVKLTLHRDELLCVIFNETLKTSAYINTPSVNHSDLAITIRDFILEMSTQHPSWRNPCIKIVGQEVAATELELLLTKLELKLIRKATTKQDTTEVWLYAESGRLRIESNSSIPSKKIRALIVDDSASVRTLLTKILSSEPQFEVVGAAERPSQVENMILTLKPDVMTLDIHMPEMDGVTLLRKLIHKYPIPTVMISSISMEESNQVLTALEIGAVDYIQKPSFQELDKVIPMIIEKIKLAASIRVRKHYTPSSQRPELQISKHSLSKSTVIAIGASTGGTEALRSILTQLPSEIPPILIVQHIPPVFSTALAARLSNLCKFEVREAIDGDEIRPGRVLLAPGGLHMSVVKKNSSLFVCVKDGQPVNRHKPSVDVLFDSVAQHIGKRSIGIILTGMGTDGARGLLNMKKANAITLAQDEASCVVFGMPREAIRIGAADKTVHLDDIPTTLVNLLQQKELAA